ncbi:MAG: hypothetical protein Aurels2KO_02760 [Aureliella sp.]
MENLSINAASAIKQAQVSNDVAFAVAKKSASTQKQQGEAAVDLVKQVEQVSSQLAQGRLDVTV